MDPLSSEIDENYFLSNYLKSLEIVLQYTGNEETSVQEDLLKPSRNSESVFELTSVLSLPPFFHINKTETQLQIGAVKNRGLPFPQLPVEGLST